MTVPTTKTDIAKMALSMLVSAKATDATKHVVVEYGELDPDSTLVSIGSAATGAYVAYKARPLTDAAVDKTVTTFQSWREKRQAKKSAK